VQEYGRAGQPTDESIIRRMRFACWINTVTDTYSEYVLLIALPRQTWFRERAPFFTLVYTFPLLFPLFCNVLRDHIREKCSVTSCVSDFLAMSAKHLGKGF
jgi:hypothetical protein